MTYRARLTFVALRYAARGLAWAVSWIVRGSFALQRVNTSLIQAQLATALELQPQHGAILNLKWRTAMPPVPIAPTSPAPRKGAALLHCTWCCLDTIHFRHGDRFVCINQPKHTETFAYRSLASAYADAEIYPGCICAPGEISMFGRPDPACHGLDHRP